MFRLKPDRRNAHAEVDHSAHNTSSGWKNSRMNRASSELSPNASVPVTNCEMFPGKIAMKNAATVRPTHCFQRHRKRSESPRETSTTPDARTTKSGSSGNQVGTCARNSVRAEPRWLTPAKVSAVPKRTRATVRARRPALVVVTALFRDARARHRQQVEGRVELSERDVAALDVSEVDDRVTHRESRLD